MDQGPEKRTPTGFPHPWLRSERLVPRIVMRPLERFLQLEAGSASLLLGAAVVALVWSNLAAGSYDRFWSTELGLDVGPFEINEDLRHVVNDLLMAIFFYVVALEVKREILFGSLRDRRSAAVPVAAAFGTMVGGAAVYLAINVDGGEPSGWAIPAATDIAFALAVLGLVGSRAAAGLRPFVLTLAIVDDLATIAIIALFYSEGVSPVWLGAATGIVLAILLLQRLAVRHLIPYVALAAALWIAIFEAGVHGTIAGVLLGFLTPALAFQSSRPTAALLGDRLSAASRSDNDLADETFLEASTLAREAVSPLARMESQFHPWSAYLILPLFALANAGVTVSIGGIGEALTSKVGLGVFLGLVVGAPLGGILFAWLPVRLGPARVPNGLNWAAIGCVTPLKGIGFTVAIFITTLAFEDEALREQATLAILFGSAAAAAIGFVALHALHKIRPTGESRDGAFG